MKKAIKKVFIVGLYKSGTSWLTEILSHSPGICGFNEIDLIRCINGIEKTKFSPLAPEEIIKNIFGRSAVMNLPKPFVDERAYKALLGEQDFLELEKDEDIYTLPSERLVSLLWAAGKQQNEKSTVERKRWKTLINCIIEMRDWPSSENMAFCRDLAFGEGGRSPRDYNAIDRQEAVKMINTVRSESNPLKLLDCISGMFEASVGGGEEILLFKGADQIARFDLLEQWAPDSKKIAIVRDARDAMISAQHFRKLMLKRQSSFTPDNAVTDYFTLLRGWNGRAEMVHRYAEQGRLKVIRYEDLQYDFVNTMSELYSWLGVGISDKQIQRIRVSTSFRVQTGRRPGKAEESIRRMGICGEWKGVLSKREKEMAWQISGEMLERFGYTKNGN